MINIFRKTIKAYKIVISPIFTNLFGKGCRFSPTCSEYAELAIVRFGIIKGTYLTLLRLTRCNPFVRSGEDPLPKEFHFIQ